MSELAHQLGLTGVEASIRWMPVLFVAGLLAVLLRRGRAELRHRVWLCALVALPLLPLLSWSLPDWQMRPVVEVLESWASGEIAERSAPHRVQGGEALVEGTRTPATMAGREGSIAAAPRAAAPRVASIAGAASIWGWIWGLGAVSLLLGNGLGVVAAARLWRGGEPVARERFPLRCAGLRLPPVRSARVEVPMICGVLRQGILLPSEWCEWPAEWIRAALVHETAHARRRDVLIQVISRLVVAAFWFHPGVWFVHLRLCREAEYASDELAVESGVDRFTYASALVEMARQLGSRRTAMAAIPMAGRGGMRDRLLRIAVVPPRRPAWRSALAAVAAVAPLLAVTVGVAAASLASPGGAWVERVALSSDAVAWQLACAREDQTCLALRSTLLDALGSLDASGLAAVTEVATGRLVGYAFVDREGHGSPVPSIGVGVAAALPLAATWWELGMGDRRQPCPGTINLAGVGSYSNSKGLDTGVVRAPADVLRLGCATGAIAMGWYLAEERGTEAVSQAFARFGFAPDDAGPLWSDVPLELQPPSPFVPVVHRSAEATWMLAGSEHGSVRTSPLHLARFLEAVGNGGVMRQTSSPDGRGRSVAQRLLSADTSRRLLEAMASTVISLPTRPGPVRRLVGIEGPASHARPGGREEIFAGFVLDEAESPRYAVVTWLRSPARSGRRDGGHAGALAAAFVGSLD